MYRAFVGRRIRNTFLEELSRGDYPAIVSRTAPNVVHTFPGAGALAGTRRSREALGLWLVRTFRLFPVLRFAVADVFVTGWPWRTVVARRCRGRSPRLGRQRGGIRRAPSSLITSPFSIGFSAM